MFCSFLVFFFSLHRNEMCFLGFFPFFLSLLRTMQLDLLFSGTMDMACERAREKGAWLLVNIQSEMEFDSHKLNRDVWKDKAVRIIWYYLVLVCDVCCISFSAPFRYRCWQIVDVVKSQFVFWQQNVGSEAGYTAAFFCVFCLFVHLFLSLLVCCFCCCCCCCCCCFEFS